VADPLVPAPARRGFRVPTGSPSRPCRAGARRPRASRPVPRRARAALGGAARSDMPAIRGVRRRLPSVPVRTHAVRCRSGTER